MNENEFMVESFREATAAYSRGKVPVGAVFVKDSEIISRAGNEDLARCVVMQCSKPKSLVLFQVRKHSYEEKNRATP